MDVINNLVYDMTFPLCKALACKLSSVKRSKYIEIEKTGYRKTLRANSPHIRQSLTYSNLSWHLNMQYIQIK